MLFLVALVSHREVEASQTIRQGGVDLLQTLLKVSIALTMQPTDKPYK